MHAAAWLHRAARDLPLPLRRARYAARDRPLPWTTSPDSARHSLGLTSQRSAAAAMSRRASRRSAAGCPSADAGAAARELL
jgi:hypothetical protein